MRAFREFRAVALALTVANASVVAIAQEQPAGQLATAVQAKARGETPNDGTDPTKPVRTASILFEHLDLRNHFTSDIVSVNYTQPLGNGRSSLKVEIPFSSIDVLGQKKMAVGDISVKYTKIPVVTQKYGIVYAIEVLLNTAQRPEHNIGASEVVPAGAEQPDRVQAIIARGQPLSDILDAEGIIAEEVALVWSDVQGCERDVILTGAGLWRRGVPLWVECAPVLLARHGGCAAFLEAARTHFIACIDAATVLREGAAALPRPINELAAIIDAVDMSTDVLLLPSGFDRPHPGSGT